MNRMFRRACHVLLSVAALSAGNAALAEPAPHAQIYAIKVGHMVVLPKGWLSIAFTSVATDSRCPKGVTCIWEGDAEIALMVKRGNMGPEELRLHTSSRFAQIGTFSGYEIKLLSLKPAPRSTTTTTTAPTAGAAASTCTTTRGTTGTTTGRTPAKTGWTTARTSC